jgi:acetyl-CoA C-acetyltransferase
MRDAVIVSTARTAIGKAYRGGFNATLGATLGSYSLKAAVERAGIDGAEVDDVLWGSALQQGTQGGNIARQVALRSGLPVTTSGMSMDRQCSSGLMTIATAAKQIIVDNVDVIAAGGQESISLVQTKEMRVQMDMELVAMHNAVYMPMLQTAEVVAKRYNISRDAMDEYALASQQRTAAAQAAGKFDDEIVPVTTMMNVVNKETGEVSQKEVTIAKDEGNRARHHAGRIEVAEHGSARRYDHRRQCQPAVRWFVRRNPDGSQGRREKRPQPAWPLCRYGGCWHRA